MVSSRQVWECIIGRTSRQGWRTPLRAPLRPLLPRRPCYPCPDATPNTYAPAIPTNKKQVAVTTHRDPRACGDPRPHRASQGRRRLQCFHPPRPHLHATLHASPQPRALVRRPTCAPNLWHRATETDAEALHTIPRHPLQAPKCLRRPWPPPSGAPMPPPDNSGAPSHHRPITLADFTDRSSLIHNIEGTLLASPPPVACPACDRTFVKPGSLVQHIRSRAANGDAYHAALPEAAADDIPPSTQGTLHASPPPATCPACGSTFAKPSSLVQHIRARAANGDADHAALPEAFDVRCPGQGPPRPACAHPQCTYAVNEDPGISAHFCC